MASSSVGQAGDRDALGHLDRLGVEGLGDAAVRAGAAHTATRGALLDLAPVAEHAARAAADERRRGERLVDALERRLRRREVRAGGEQAGDVGRAAELRARLRARLDRRDPRVRAGRQPAADAHAHRC